MAVDKFSSVFTNSHKRLRRVKSRQAGQRMYTRTPAPGGEDWSADGGTARSER